MKKTRPPAEILRTAKARLAKEKTHDAALAVQHAQAALNAFRKENMKVVP
jgi:hypothetical protein